MDMEKEMRSRNFKASSSNFDDALLGMEVSNGIIKKLENNMEIRNSLPAAELGNRLKKVSMIR